MDEAGEGAPSPAPHPNRQTQTSKAELSTWLRTGTFYLALTFELISRDSAKALEIDQPGY
jgi:hypothetical protein